ncbi:hypothetical protein [Stenotrophomonas sp. YAU14D1_LEIMI4_1]|uniref:hypothetical protein n=1 Tax=Stenotrophomonas sp. YAU14D1_LEIMI4_1 TaxID=2072407 RepID=UPI00131F3E64|nr:hypothetical protein [Stenotrophomonas sp. YAU14D1_LEIMI4_1]
MPIRFIPVENTAFDPESGVTISFPRMLPAIRRDGSDEIEYQYMFWRKDERVGGTGFFGTSQVIEQHGDREVRYTLELSPHQALESILRLQKRLGNTDEKYSFICSVAEGLVTVFSGRVNNTERRRYVALAKVDDLVRLGASPPNVAQSDDGSIVLASICVPELCD